MMLKLFVRIVIVIKYYKSLGKCLVGKFVFLINSGDMAKHYFQLNTVEKYFQNVLIISIFQCVSNSSKFINTLQLELPAQTLNTTVTIQIFVCFFVVFF